MSGGELQCSKAGGKRVREMCGGDLQCSKGGKTRVREMCGEFCCVQEVAKRVCGNCAGILVVSKRWQQTCAGNVRGILLCSKGGKHVCGKCAGANVGDTTLSYSVISGHYARHTVAILAQDACMTQKRAALPHAASALSQASAMLKLSGEARYRRMDEGTGWGALASGSFGKVYIAVDNHTGATVAVKRQDLPSDAAARELAFYMALRHNTHPNIMSLLDHFNAVIKRNTYLYMVFDVMDSSLFHKWKNHRRMLPPMLASTYLRHLVQGAAHMHDMSIVHADLCMANLLVGRRQDAGFEPSGDILRISDLGGAWCAHQMVLKADDVITTESCRAPEVFLGSLILSSAVDMWAIGTVGVSLLCGSTIFWRPATFEPDHDGFEPRSEEKAEWPSIFANQAQVLGPLTAAIWPGCEDLPEWSKVASLVARSPRYGSLSAALVDTSFVRRAADPNGAAVALLGAWLRWAPSSRMAARESLDAAFFADPTAGPPAVAAAVVMSASVEALRSMVLKSWWSGVPVSLGQMVQQVAAEQRIASAPSQDQAHEASTTAAGGCDAAASSQAMPPKRIRLTQKTDSSFCSVYYVPPCSVAVPAGEPSSNVTRGAEATSEMNSGFEPSVCKCRGNCGNRACRRVCVSHQRNATHGTVCSHQCLPGEKLCAWCKCELCSKGRQSSHCGQGRWCTSCGQECDAAGKGKYFNEHGSWHMCRSWPLTLQCTARMAYITRMLPPEDHAAWHVFLQDFELQRLRRSVSIPSEEPPPACPDDFGDVFFLCLVSLVKWPCLLRQALSQLETSGIVTRTATAADWRRFLVDLCRFADGRPVADELRSISPGRTAAVCGLLWTATQWGVLQKVSGGVEPIGGATVFALGSMQQRYMVLPEETGIAALERAMDVVRRTSLQYPASGQVTATMLQNVVMTVGEMCRKLCGKTSTLRMGGLARRLLSVVEMRCGPGVWDECNMAMFSGVLPDMQGYAVCLRNCKVGEVRRCFGMSPLSISAMACLWGEVPAASLKKALQAKYVSILRAVGEAGTQHAQPRDWVPHL